MSETLIAVYDHQDGSRSELHYDMDASYANPRDDYGNVATLIQTNSDYSDVDNDVAGLDEARDKFDFLDTSQRQAQALGYNATELMLCRAMSSEDAVRRYIAMFRPDILHYEERWSAGDSHGWGYVTRKAYEAAMCGKGETAEDVSGVVLQLDPGQERRTVPTPAECFDQEVESYRMWCEGEVYGVVTYEPTTCRVCGVSVRPAYDDGDPIQVYGPVESEPVWTAGWSEDGVWTDADGAPSVCQDGHEHVPLIDGPAESCWGFLGYDGGEQIVAQVHGSPIIEEHTN